MSETKHNQPTRWQQELSRALTLPEDLLTALHLDHGQYNPGSTESNDQISSFPMRVPDSFVARMRPGDPDDPLLRQVFPSPEEFLDTEGYVDDPVGDTASVRGAGILQKYEGRALLMLTGACAVHCRYCFRRNFPYSQHAMKSRDIDKAVHLLNEDPSISEVILSGGDPLSLTDDRLGYLFTRLSAISHLRRVRIHTRHPIVLPGRVDSRLIDSLKQIRQSLIIVVHANHANEINAEVKDALSELADHSALLLNQSVLLKGVNDSVAALVDLCESLFDAGVLPYYIHQLDPVRGAAHFKVADSTAQRLIGEVSKKLPGYLVPRLVREQSGAPAKLWLTPSLHNSTLHNMTHVT